MKFELSAEQVSLKRMARDLLSRTYDYESVAEATESDVGWTPDVWKSLGKTGILGLCVAEEYGGAGAGVAELAAIAGEFGRVLAPEPVLDAAVLPAELIGRAGTAEQSVRWLPPLAAGDALGAVAHEELGDRWPIRRVQSEATRIDTGYAISGRKILVRQGHRADTVVVSARLDGDVALFLVDPNQPGVRRTEYRSHDRSRGAHIELDRASAELLPEGNAAAALSGTQALAHAVLCAEAVGAMDAALSITVDHLKNRRQFGVPLSSFQALSHRAADLFVLVELARSMSEYATARLGDGVADPCVISRADLQVCRSARALAHECIHLHGGIGVTDEHPIGHLASRLVAIEQQLGGADAHLTRLAGDVDKYATVMTR